MRHACHGLRALTCCDKSDPGGTGDPGDNPQVFAGRMFVKHALFLPLKSAALRTLPLRRVGTKYRETSTNIARSTSRIQVSRDFISHRSLYMEDPITARRQISLSLCSPSPTHTQTHARTDTRTRTVSRLWETKYRETSAHTVRSKQRTDIRSCIGCCVLWNCFGKHKICHWWLLKVSKVLHVTTVESSENYPRVIQQGATKLHNHLRWE